MLSNTLFPTLHSLCYFKESPSKKSVTKHYFGSSTVENAACVNKDKATGELLAFTCIYTLMNIS